MGGPGSGRFGAPHYRGRYVADDMRNLPVGDEGGLSRVSLEPWMRRCLRVGETATAEAIRVELAGRTWQWHNPYAEA